jgi:hypothetical protein
LHQTLATAILQGKILLESGIRRSHHLSKALFEPFSMHFEVPSWPAYSGISCEWISKSMKKFFKNHPFKIVR